MNILYVENHAVFASSVIRQFLSNHQVKVVPNLLTARQSLAAETFDLLLVDYDLDDGKGDELVLELRASARQIRIIGVSSHDEGNAALMQAGANATCSKMKFDRIAGVMAQLSPPATSKS